MRALVHTAPFEFELQDLEQPSPQTGEVLIRVRAVGICGSDVHGMSGTTGRRIPPVIMGHEAAGDVVAVGGHVDESWVGRRVTFDSTIYCGKCDYCKSGHVNLCDNRMVLGVSCDEYRRDGALAEYVAVPEHILYELPDDVSYDHGAMAEPLSVALHAVRRSPLGHDDRVLVVGCGIIGLLTIQAARATGCGTIVATDLSRRRLEAARVCGADITVQPDELESIEEVEVAFEAVGASPSFAAALGKLRKGGKIVLIGNVTPEVPFAMQRAVTRQLTVFGSCASAGEYADCLMMIQSGAVNPAPLISDVVPLGEAATMFNRLYESPDDHLKVIVHPGGDDV